MTRKKKSSIDTGSPTDSSDQVINELIQKRRLQQEALLKIMTSMDKNDEATPPPSSDPSDRKKIRAEKVFSTDKKAKK